MELWSHISAYTFMASIEISYAGRQWVDARWMADI